MSSTSINNNNNNFLTANNSQQQHQGDSMALLEESSSRSSRLSKSRSPEEHDDDEDKSFIKNPENDDFEIDGNENRNFVHHHHNKSTTATSSARNSPAKQGYVNPSQIFENQQHQNSETNMNNTNNRESMMALLSDPERTALIDDESMLMTDVNQMTDHLDRYNNNNNNNNTDGNTTSREGSVFIHNNNNNPISGRASTATSTASGANTNAVIHPRRPSVKTTFELTHDPDEFCSLDDDEKEYYHQNQNQNQNQNHNNNNNNTSLLEVSAITAPPHHHEQQNHSKIYDLPLSSAETQEEQSPSVRRGGDDNVVIPADSYGVHHNHHNYPHDAQQQQQIERSVSRNLLRDDVDDDHDKSFKYNNNNYNDHGHKHDEVYRHLGDSVSPFRSSSNHSNHNHHHQNVHHVMSGLAKSALGHGLEKSKNDEDNFHQNNTNISPHHHRHAQTEDEQEKNNLMRKMQQDDPRDILQNDPRIPHEMPKTPSSFDSYMETQFDPSKFNKNDAAFFLALQNRLKQLRTGLYGGNELLQSVGMRKNNNNNQRTEKEFDLTKSVQEAKLKRKQEEDDEFFRLYYRPGSCFSAVSDVHQSLNQTRNKLNQSFESTARQEDERRRKMERLRNDLSQFSVSQDNLGNRLRESRKNLFLSNHPSSSSSAFSSSIMSGNNNYPNRNSIVRQGSASRRDDDDENTSIINFNNKTKKKENDVEESTKRVFANIAAEISHEKRTLHRRFLTPSYQEVAMKDWKK